MQDKNNYQNYLSLIFFIFLYPSHFGSLQAAKFDERRDANTALDQNEGYVENDEIEMPVKVEKVVLRSEGEICIIYKKNLFYFFQLFMVD